MLIGLVLIVVTFCPFLSIQTASAAKYPQIIAIDKTPINPTSDLAVNITFQIVDEYGFFINCSLYYPINGSSDFNQLSAKIIDGDYRNGTFTVQIPKQPNNTTVQYFAEVQDSIGYIAKSPNYSYTVSIDTSPPIITDTKRVNPVGSPVLPSENVTVTANITDDGSGVKNATLFYGTGDDPWNMPFIETAMIQKDSDKYLGTIPPYPNGTYVYYFIAAFDNANNSMQENARYNYFVSESNKDFLEININVKNIYMNNLTATVELTVLGMLHSIDEQPLIIHINYPPYSIIQINASSGSDRFSYQSVTDYDFYLSGNPNLYPFDSYELNLTFTVYWSQPQSFTTSTAISQPFFYNVWNGYYTHYNTTDKISKTSFFAGYPVMVSALEIERNTYGDAFPLIALITLLFFLLGGTLLIDPTKLNERLTIILAIFIFMAGFYFTQSATLPVLHTGFTVAERLFLSLVAGSALFGVASLFSSSMGNLKHFHSSKKSVSFVISNLGLILDGCALAIFFIFWLFSIVMVTPFLITFLIAFGVLYGIFFRAILCQMHSVKQKIDRQIV